jgi:hypothetical protein
MYYTVMLDGNAIAEQKIIFTEGQIFKKSIEAIKLRPGEHTLVFQGRTNENQDESLFLDDVSLKVERVLPGFSLVVR